MENEGDPSEEKPGTERMSTQHHVNLQPPDLQPVCRRLGGQELLALKKLNPSLPVRGEKETIPDDSPWQAQRLKEAYNTQKMILSEERGVRLGSIARAIWHSDVSLAEVTAEKGKFWLTMGHHRMGKKWLYPEETLFLIDVGALELFFDGITLSVQEAYAMLIPEHIPMEYYQVYSHLQTLGYIVTRHHGSNFTQYEKSIRLDQYVSRSRNSPLQAMNWQQESSESNEPASTSSECDGRYIRHYTPLTTTGSSGDSQSPKSLLSESESESGSDGSQDSLDEFSDGTVVIPEEKAKSESDYSINLLEFKRKMERRDREDVEGGGGDRKRQRKQNDKNKGDIKSTDKSVNGKEHLGNLKVNEKDNKREKGTARKRSRSWEHNSKQRPYSSDSSDYFKRRPQASHDNEFGTVESTVDLNDVFDVFRDLAKCPVPMGTGLAITNELWTDTETRHSNWNFNQILLPNQAEDIPLNELPVMKPGLLPESIESATREKLQMDANNMLKLQQLICISNSVMKTSESMAAMSKTVCERVKAIGTMHPHTSKAEKTGLLGKARNWSEFKKLQRQQQKNSVSKNGSPWEGDSIQPLVQPASAMNTASLLDQLKIIPNVNMSGDRRFLKEVSSSVQIVFDIYLPDSRYRKSNPGKPHLRVSIMTYEDPPPSLHTIATLMSQSQGVPLLWAVLDNGDITFNAFHDVNIPRDINLG
ncbi:tRNA-splicing endonuclease subunit Sen54-like [Ptychodera flava]|uniref:tRNA-splicing endonuclease subunit Sen54-like n=1 Tax=Ptychodera flava TaxID=63121 RepID=UPI003969C796